MARPQRRLRPASGLAERSQSRMARSTAASGGRSEVQALLAGGSDPPCAAPPASVRCPRAIGTVSRSSRSCGPRRRLSGCAAVRSLLLVLCALKQSRPTSAAWTKARHSDRRVAIRKPTSSASNVIPRAVRPWTAVRPKAEQTRLGTAPGARPAHGCAQLRQPTTRPEGGEQLPTRQAKNPPRFSLRLCRRPGASLRLLALP